MDTQVIPVLSLGQFVNSLELRYRIYRKLGYIASDSLTDIDKFDWSSFHFIAVEGEPKQGPALGTVRLVVQSLNDEFKSKELSLAKEWVVELLAKLQVNVDFSTSIPILETIFDNCDSIESLDSVRPCELSRIIVDKSRRGKGISRLLASAVVDKAKELGCDALFLQCLPEHVEYFQKLGFDVIFESLNYRHLSVPSNVVAMQQRL